MFPDFVVFTFKGELVAENRACIRRVLLYETLPSNTSIPRTLRTLYIAYSTSTSDSVNYVFDTEEEAQAVFKLLTTGK